MQSGKLSNRSLSILASLFILVYFLLFSYNGLSAHLTFDDGMNFVTMNHQWEVSLWRNIWDALKVFTTANRPLGALFYRPLYYFFGFNYLPYRIAVYLFLTLNIGLAYLFARTLDASREAAALSTLLFCYNPSLIDLYYSTGTVYDVLCFPLYIGALLIYVRERSLRNHLSGRTMLVVTLLYLAALDAKEMSVTLPACLVIYELLYRYRDLKSRSMLLRLGGFFAILAIITVVYLRVKVTDMSHNSAYNPHLSLQFVLTGMSRYLEQFCSMKPLSYGAGRAGLTFVALLGVGVALRSRQLLYGTLFFIVGLIPVSIIPPRGSYAAYVAFPGLTVALGVILAAARSAVFQFSTRSLSIRALSRKEKLDQVTAIALFLLVAVLSVKHFAKYRKVGMANVLWSQERVIGLLDGFKRTIPEFPPDGRILILEDPWGPDWGPMFLTQLMYHDPYVWVDRSANPEKTGPPESYDLFVRYKQPYIDMHPAHLLGLTMNWEIRATTTVDGEFIVSAPTESRAPRNIDFLPVAARTGRPVTVTVPGIANTPIDAVYRILSNGTSTVHVATGWCKLDDKGTCTVTAPAPGKSECWWSIGYAGLTNVGFSPMAC